MEHLLSVLGAQVEGDRALPPVGQRDREVHAAAVAADPLRGEAPVRVALRPIDPDDVGAPVGQQGAGDGHEHPLGELDDPDALERAVSHRVGVSTTTGMSRSVRVWYTS